MDYTLFGARMALSVIMLIAGIMKMRDPGSLKSALQVSGFSNEFSLLIATFLPAVEISLGISLIFATPITLPYSLILCTLLLLTFTGWLIWIHMRRIDVSCGCFGNNQRKVGISSLVRNIIFIIVASVGAFLAIEQSVPLVTLSVEYTTVTLLTLALLMFIVLPAVALAKAQQKRADIHRTSSLSTTTSAAQLVRSPRRRFIYRAGVVIAALIAASRLDTALALTNCATGSQACRCNHVSYQYSDCSGCDCAGLPPGGECWASVYVVDQYSCCTPDINAGKVCAQYFTRTGDYIVCCRAGCGC